jgi:NADPH:quinone reductase-like Zn-dependent oxidoreductase
VERVGRNVTTLRAGDEVFGSSFTEGLGAFADYVAVSERVLAPKPASLSFEQAAALPMAGLTALQALRDGGRVEPGQRVLVIGASGGVGSFAVQLAKSLGAEVTGVASTPNVELVSSLGADHVIDYTRADFARGEERYDVVVHLAGIRPLADLRRVLTPRGVLLLLSGDSDNRWLGPVPGLARALARSAVVGQRYRVVMVKPNRHDLEHLAGLVEAGELSPVISRTWPLDGVAEAVRWVEAGHTRGKVAVCVSEAVSEAREAMPIGAAIGGAAC